MLLRLLAVACKISEYLRAEGLGDNLEAFFVCNVMAINRKIQVDDVGNKPSHRT